jgi:hypothetical protein
MMHRALPALAMFAVAAAQAQDIRWINPAGGAFGDAANWEGGVAPTQTPPSYPNPARFDLNAAYAVSAGDIAVDGLKFLAGDVTFAPGRVNTPRVEVGVPGGPQTRFVLATGSLSFANGSSYSPMYLTIRNAVVEGAGLLVPWAGQITLSDGADVTLDVNKHFSQTNVAVDATSTLRVRSYQYGGSFQSNGRVVMDGGTLSYNGLTISGFLHATGSVLAADSLGITGRVELLDTRVTANFWSNGAVGGDVSARGTGSVISVGSVTGDIRLSDGAQLASPCTASSAARVHVMTGASAPLVNLTHPDSVLRAHPSQARPLGPTGVYCGQAGLEFVIDALDLPQGPQVTTNYPVGGRLAIEVTNSNALRAGQQVPLLRLGETGSAQFAAMNLPQLAGNRRLDVSTIGGVLTLLVLTGGNQPCWTIDFNGDGDYGTDQDIEAFFACIAGNCCAACGSADFNGDGDFGTDQDIEAFFRLLAGAPC